MRRGLRHVESGTGRVPLVCVHGWCCEGSQFRDLADRLSDKFRIYLVDLPGHGKTGLGGFRPAFAAFAECLSEFLDRHVPGRPVLVGHSMGGMIALLTAATRECRAIINLDGSFPATPATREGLQSLGRLLAGPDPLPRLADFLRQAFFLPGERHGRCEEIVQAMCRAPEPILRFLPEQAGTLQPEAVLPAIRSPVLYVGSDRPRFDGAATARLNPGFRISRISGAGHFLHLFATDRVADLILDFAEAAGAVPR